MSAKNIPTLLFLLSFPIAVQAQAAADELSQLRDEIDALKARNEVLERACPVVGAANASTLAAPPAPAASSRAVTAAAAPAAATIATSEPPKLYADTGCDRGLFSGPPPGKWQDSRAWKNVTNGMTMATVEAALGVEHYDKEKGNAVQWQYGRCGINWEGSVMFENGLVVSSSPPER